MSNNTKNLLTKILSIFLIIPFYYLTKEIDIFLYVLSFSLYLVLTNAFSHIKIENILKRYDEQLGIQDKIFKKGLLGILIISSVISVFVILSSFWLERIFDIKGLVIVYLAMSFTISVLPSINLLKGYLQFNGYKRLSNELLNIYRLLNICFFLIISVLLFKVFTLEGYISLSLLYIAPLISGFLIYLFVYLFIFKQKKYQLRLLTEKKEINYPKLIRELLFNNVEISFVNMVKYSYYYISLIFLYLILVNRYGYSYQFTSNIITIIYFYALRIISFTIVITLSLSKKTLTKLKEKIERKDYEQFAIQSRSFFTKLFRILLTVVILTGVISGAIWMLIFGNNIGTYLLMFLSITVLLIVFYIMIMEILISLKKAKYLYISLAVGLIVKIILTIPLVDSFYRMGYNLVYGDILSNIIAYLFAVIIGAAFINRKTKHHFLITLETGLKTLYENIILCLILVLFNVVVPVEVGDRLHALGVIFIYIVATMIYWIIRRTLRTIKKEVKK